jgi:hypothetical protein
MRSRATRDLLLLLPWPMPMARHERRAHPVVGANIFRTIRAHAGVRCFELLLIQCGVAAAVTRGAVGAARGNATGWPSCGFVTRGGVFG